MLYLLAGVGCRRAKLATDSLVKVPAASEPMAALPAGVQRGMSFVHSWEQGGAHGYGSPTSRRALQ